MWRSTPERVRVLRQRYEETDQLMTSIAAEFEISVRTLGRMVQVEGWRKRSEQRHGLPVAVQLLEDAKALSAERCHYREGGNPVIAEAAAKELDPRLRGDNRDASAIDRIEALVVKEIAAAEAARAHVTDKRQLAKVSENSARTLATLTQTLRTLQQMRTGKSAETEMTDYDDMPRDIDEFRHALARRIAAFMESRPDDEDADAGGDAARLDDVR